MSLLSQFFGGGGGSSSSSSEIESRILIVDGGQGAGYGAAPATPNRVAGAGGRVYELNVLLISGSVCPVTVGYGGTSANRTANIYCPGPPYSPPGTRVLSTSSILGDYGSFSSFSTLQLSCNYPISSCPLGLPPACGFGRCYIPQSDFTKLLTLDASKQVVPLSTYDQNPGKAELEEYAIPTNPMYCLARGGIYDPCSTSNLSCYQVLSNALRNSQISYNACVYDLTYATGGGYDRGGHVSDITGCICVYGAGGLKGYFYGSPTPAACCAATTPPSELCRTEYTYTGSGAGAPTLGGAPIPTINGCPGIVVVQYPTIHGCAITSSPNVCDCSPLTPGYRTYKFYCPGTITLP
jgi:hypothetical protein